MLMKYGPLENTGYARWAQDQRKEFRQGYQDACQGKPRKPGQDHYYKRGHWTAQRDLERL